VKSASNTKWLWVWVVTIGALGRIATNPNIDDCRERGVPVIVGDALHTPVLRRAAVGRAKWVLAFCSDDATNTENMLSAQAIVQDRKGAALNCLAQISNPQLCSMLRS